MEVDGDIHDLQKEEDERREKVLSEMGLRVVRFGNDEVVRNHPRIFSRIIEWRRQFVNSFSIRGR